MNNKKIQTVSIPTDIKYQEKNTLFYQSIEIANTFYYKTTRTNVLYSDNNNLGDLLENYLRRLKSDQLYDK